MIKSPVAEMVHLILCCWRYVCVQDCVYMEIRLGLEGGVKEILKNFAEKIETRVRQRVQLDWMFLLARCFRTGICSSG